MKRAYELRRRAERRDETRRRIVEATVALHTSVGPARTSIKAIAERAGVERHTVYAHFPEERTLFDACTAHWYDHHPFPNVGATLAIGDPERRLRRTLDSVYAWYEANEREIEPLRRDTAVHTLTAEFMGAFDRSLAGLAHELASAFGRSRRVRAAAGHALAFETWQSLTRQGLTRRGAVDLMVRLVVAAR
jgi:AcrR family transcriptional regulator